MEKNMITIPVYEYKELLENAVRIGIFADFVDRSEYSISREDCGRYLNFEVTENEYD